MFKIIALALSLMFAGVAQAANYSCMSTFSNVSSQIWNGAYQISVRPGFNGGAVAQVRLNRHYPGPDLPRVEMIQMDCMPGTNGAEFNCVETDSINQRVEILVAQFFPNGWAILYATPRDVWQPYALGNIQCMRM